VPALVKALRRWALFFLSLFSFFALLRTCHRFHCSALKITVFDVAQGDSILLELPRGQTALVDGGGAFKTWNLGQRELYGELARKGVLTVDHLVLSHPDMDHAGGLVGLIPQLKIKNFWISPVAEKAPVLDELLLRAKEKNIFIHPAVSGQRIIFSGGAITLWAPEIRNQGSNNQSLVAEVEFAGCRVLLTGDLEAAGEQWLLRQTIPKIDILKVGHHGSKSSTTEPFLKKYRPKIAVISSGKNNPYGHPHRSTLNRLREFNSQIFRTDFHGYLEFLISEKGTIVCRSAIGACGMWHCSP
jgi:competence protein ComEC